MTDESEANTSTLVSNANASFLLSALSTVSELKTHLDQLSQLINSDEAVPHADASSSMNMQVESLLEDKTTSMQTNVVMESESSILNPHDSQRHLMDLARSILDNSTRAVQLLHSHHCSLVQIAQDIEFSCNESNLLDHEIAETERCLVAADSQNRHGQSDDNMSEEQDTLRVSLLDQTEVFVLLEQQEKRSSDELEKIKSTFENERAHISSEMNRYKEKYSAMEQENNALKIRYAELEEELTNAKDNHAAEHKTWSASYSQAMAQVSQLQQELDDVRQQAERECQNLRSKYTKLQAELQDITNRHVPAQLFPWIAEVPRRILHYLVKVENHCPWLPAALAKSDDTVLPNPEVLLREHDQTVQQLTTERDQAQDKLTKVTAELSALQLAHTEQTQRLQEMEKQSRADKADLDKLRKNVLRYQSYFKQLLTPETAPHFLPILNRMSRTGPSIPVPAVSEGAVAAMDSSKSSEISVSVSGMSSTQQNSEISMFGRSTSASSPSNAIKPSPPVVSVTTTTSPSVLSRVTAAVSAIATAMISPKRTGTPHSPRQPVSVPMQELSRQNKRSPDSYATAPEWQVSSQLKAAQNNKINWSVGTTATPCVSVSARANSAPDTQPFAVPALPAATGRHPLALKRKPLAEIPVVVEEAGSAQSGQERIPTTTGTVWSKAPWKNADPTAIEPNKGLKLETNAFLLEGPLAESTSGPFRAPVLPPAAAVDQNAKRPRPEPSNAFLLDGPLAESTSGPFRAPALPPAAAVVDQNVKRPRPEPQAGAFLLEGPLAESTAGPFRPPSEPLPLSGNQNVKRDRPDPIPTPVVPKFAPPSATPKTMFKPSPKPDQFDNRERVPTASTTRPSVVAFADRPAKSGRTKPFEAQECSPS